MDSSILTNDRQALRVFKAAFPDTKFRKLRIRAFRGPMSLNSYWDSGYRDYFVIIEIATGKQVGTVPQNGTPYDRKNLSLSQLPSGYAVAVHHYAGVREYGSLHLNEADITPMLPAPTESAPRAILVA